MFGRGNDNFQKELEKKTTIGRMKNLYLLKDKNTGKPIPKNVLHLSSMEEAVAVSLHVVNIQGGKMVHALCLASIGQPCPFCIQQLNKQTFAIHKVYDTTTYTDQQNQQKRVGMRPLLAGKSVQNLLNAVASNTNIKGKVLTHLEHGKNPRINVYATQLDANVLAKFNPMMGGYTDDEIMKMIPVTTAEQMNEISPFLVSARGGNIGTDPLANASFSDPFSYEPNNGGGINFDRGNQGDQFNPRDGGSISKEDVKLGEQRELVNTNDSTYDDIPF